MHSKREQWAEHVQAWRVNGLSQVAWCREQGLSLASFGYWRRRLAKGPVAPAGGELPLRVQPVAARRIRLPPCGRRDAAVAGAGRSGVAGRATACAGRMLSLQRWWLVTAPTDLRCGIDRLLLAAQTAMHRTPAEGEAYVFANRAATRIKLLCCDRPGAVCLTVRGRGLAAAVYPADGRCQGAVTVAC
ncbi:IS66 family insertion sequence element accessory protein TnpA [Xanthomonas euvesicatoria]|nr:IS66 family insertion sequence element accessory protein TnpB [Xanthomonas euvesicatoria]